MLEEDGHDQDADEDDDDGCVQTHFGSGWAGLGGLGGGDDDDIVTQTPRTISPEEPYYSVFTVLSWCRTILYI